MNLMADGREYLILDLTFDLDPSADTISLSIDGTHYAMAWIAAAVQSGSTWTRSAQLLVAGPNAVGSGAIPLALGRHVTDWILTSAPELIARSSDPIYVQ